MINFTNIVFAHKFESGEADLYAAHHGFGMMDGFGFTGAFFGWTMMILFWMLVILVIVALIKYINSRGYSGSEKTKKMENGKTYICSECGYEYKEKEWAIKCQKWCTENKSCNMDIIKHGAPPQN